MYMYVCPYLWSLTARIPTPTGELIKIVIEDYVNHLANHNLKLIYKPDLLFGDGYDYDNRIHLEFNHMYHWHPFSPDEFNISGTIYSIDEFMYRPEMAVKHGMRDFVDSMSRSLAGKVCYRKSADQICPDRVLPRKFERW